MSLLQHVLRPGIGLVFIGGGVALLLWGIWGAKRALAGNLGTGLRKWVGIVEPIVFLLGGACGIFAGLIALPNTPLSMGRNAWLDAWFALSPLYLLTHVFSIMEIAGGLYFLLVPGIWGGKRALTRDTGTESKVTPPIGECVGWGVLGAGVFFLGVLGLPESPVRLAPFEMVILLPLAFIGILVMLFVSDRNARKRKAKKPGESTTAVNRQPPETDGTGAQP